MSTKGRINVNWQCDDPNAPPPVTGPLLPCPFCGEDAEAQWWHNGQYSTSISCAAEYGDCRVMPFVVKSNPARAAKAWNRRSP